MLLNRAGSIYPNPSNGIVNFKSNIDISNGNIKVINAFGQVIYEKNDFSILKNQSQNLDLLLESGVHYIQISSKLEVFSVEKVVIK